MLINGCWRQCDDNVIRPIIECEILDASGAWVSYEFLVDSGGDRTVFNAICLEQLSLPHLPAPVQLGGVGGPTNTIHVGTHLRFPLDGGGAITFEGTFAAFTNAEDLDINDLGRDIMKHFAVIVDQPRKVVRMIGNGHSYSVTRES